MGIRIQVLALLLLAGCAQGHCRHKVDAPEPKPLSEKDATPPAPVEDRTFVFKYDGSLQCGMGTPIAPETMEKELKGIPVFGRAKKSDGLQHIQACSSITGMANVYEIPAKFIGKAEKKGFKKWTFDQ